MTPYYQDSSVTLYLGDSRDVLPTLQRVDHVITDPPFAEETHKGARTGDSETALVDFVSFDFRQLAERFALLNATGARWIIASVDWRHCLPLEVSPPDGLRFVRHGVWVKTNGAPQFTGDRPAAGWEAVAILHRTGGKMKWNGGGVPATWRGPVVNDARYPSEKPIWLISEFVRLFTSEGDTILDPFCGSGTTLECAKLLGRRAIGIDRRKEALDIAIERLKQETLFAAPRAVEPEQTAMFGV